MSRVRSREAVPSAKGFSWHPGCYGWRVEFNYAAKGRLQLVFESAAKLPRRQQDKIAEFVEAFVAQHANGQS